MYIKSAKSKAQLMQVEFLTKAFIVTLQSKLEIDDSKMWRLTASICDGTGMLDVDFSDPVLTGLIGFSAAQAEEIRQNPDDRLRSLRMATASCRREIIQMCRIMKIRMGNPLKRARVVLLREADESYWRRFNMTTC
uniref:RecQ-mediated genome instability protein 1 C-terminal OB-fold domain-containing protein n=1 Tax=Ciona savignyi TaxID=51511 RepID=H2Z6S6_CIOSA